MAMLGTVLYSIHALNYKARFSNRATMAITVHPNGAVEIVAPFGVTREDIERRLLRRARWVLRQRRYFDQFRPRAPKRLYVGGETHLYLGRQYRLKVVRGLAEGVKLKGAYLTVSVPDRADLAKVKTLVRAWYREKALLRLQERFDLVSRRFKRYGLVPSKLILRAMPRRWGSYTNSGRILLNPDLIRAPMYCIDYVITHELIHLAHPDHGAGFQDMLDALMPDWYIRKARLESLLS
jgi:predicted metal-dependent hydrolase